MKQTIRTIIYVILGILMIIAFIYLGKKDYSKKNIHERDNIIMMRSYKSLNKDNVFEIIGDDELIKFLGSETGIVLFCFKEAPMCDEYAGILNNIAKTEKIDKIYYYDLYNAREVKSHHYIHIINKGREYLTKNDLGEHIVFVPNVYFLKGGELIGFNNDGSIISGLENYWTYENVSNLEIKLKDLILKLKE